ncbi:MAG TPA: sugar transferase [Thermoanaerobaculia bacterium]|nr:sugar transferase [Thermoanaerobaculia bacterium]
MKKAETSRFVSIRDERPRPPTTYRRWGKRTFDLALAVPAGLLLLPLGFLLAGLVRLRLGSPLLFRHVRPGLGGEPFTLYKLRTMRDLRDEQGELLPDEERLTPFGRWLRRTSLDELPELWNVLRGDMSLVGPRPLLLEYLPRYSAAEARRHEVLPGITGLAQVRGRNALSWEERFELDVWYVDHVSPGLDLRILLGTLLAVLRGKGISAPGHATMPRFEGRSGKEPERVPR